MNASITWTKDKLKITYEDARKPRENYNLIVGIVKMYWLKYRIYTDIEVTKPAME